MPTYNNPATMFGRNADMIPGQPFAGFLAGEQGAYAEQAAQQGIRENNLDFMANMHKYEQSKLDDPMAAAAREATIAAAGTELNWNTSGGALQAKQNASSQIAAQTDAMTESTKEKKRTAALDWINEASQFASTVDPMQDKGAINTWKEIRDRGKKEFGVSLPDEAIPSAETTAKLKYRADSAVNSITEQRRVKEQTQAQAARLAEIGAGVEGRAGVADVARSARINAEEIKATTARDVAQMRNERDTTVKTYTQMVIDNVATMVKRDMRDGQLSPETRKAAVAAANLAAKEDLSKDQNYQLDVLRGNAGDPVAKQRADDLMTKQVNYHLDTIPGFKEAEAKSAGKVVSTPDQPMPKSSPDKTQAVLQKAREGGKNKGVSDEDILKAARAAGIL